MSDVPKQFMSVLQEKLEAHGWTLNHTSTDEDISAGFENAQGQGVLVSMGHWYPNGAQHLESQPAPIVYIFVGEKHQEIAADTFLYHHSDSKALEDAAEKLVQNIKNQLANI